MMGGMVRRLVVCFALCALAVPATASARGYESSVTTLPPEVQSRLKSGGFWKPGCPVALRDLRLLTVKHWDWDGKRATGRLVVNKRAAQKLRGVFARLYGLHFPIRDMRFGHFYGPSNERYDDVTASFQCRQSVSSPCTGGGPSGRWSNHAYGLAIDINPRENPYVGCGASYNATTRRYTNRTRHLKGMITRRAVAAFASIGWGWGGSWSGDTKDYMHFSHTGG
jgi:hypothetical protein